MFGPRLTTVFASRWNALLWAACILATAYCTIPAGDEASGAEAGQTASAQGKSPWAK